MAKNWDLDDLPERLSDVSKSFDNMSLQSTDLTRSSFMSEQLQRERELALQYLNRHNLTSLPSRLLKPPEVSTPASDTYFLHSESTISESELLLTNSSTPRASVANHEQVMQKRLSFRSSVDNFSICLKDPSCDITNYMNTKSENAFRTGADAVAALEKDEISWQREKHIPAQLTEFSVGDLNPEKMSMGMFFKERSDDLSKLLARSPEKIGPPIPLIETTNTDYPRDRTLSVSYIAKVLSDPEKTPTRALDHLFNNNRESVPTASEYSQNKQALCPGNAAKENIDCLNIKANISPDFVQNKSMLSSRSSSSLSNLPNGKLPIGTTKNEIIWGCVKISKSVSQDFMICNRSSSRLGIQCSVENPSYRLVKESLESSLSSSIKVILHPYETRCITVTFAPITLGAATDYLTFTSVDSNLKQAVKQFVRLFGYGGHGNLAIGNIMKDTTGKFLLSLGNIADQQNMKKSFVVSNSGTLPVFAVLDFASSSLYSFSNIKVNPETVILMPKEEKEVIVTYVPQKGDFPHMPHTSVMDVGKLTVIYGTEVDRGRLRQVSVKAKEKGLQVVGAIYDLVEKISGEIMPKDLVHLKESAGSLGTILRLLNSKEIVIILEQDLEHTLQSFEDETVMYNSLCEATKLSSTVSVVESTCHVEPSKIVLKPPHKIRDMIFLMNKSKKNLYFEINCKPEGLSFKPKSGTILPNDTAIVGIEYNVHNEKTAFKVNIEVDNDNFEVDVKILAESM